MKTDIDLKRDLYDHLKTSALVGEVSGELLLADRPTSSLGEDVVIGVLDSDVSTDIQHAILYVNVYVPDDRTDDGQPIEASLRLRTLARLAIVALAQGWGKSGYRFELTAQRILKVQGRDEHVINNRIHYKQLIKQ